jgi:predicted DsbA family dithiol-disulfide isomerase
MPEAVPIALYADLSCPYAYLTAYRLRKLRDEYRGRIAIVHKCLALEYVNRQPTPKRALDIELAVLMLEEPDIPYEPWHAPDSTWPVTLWPAFEAVKCAERQGLELADELSWAIRTAFFAESRCVAMRDVLLELAGQAGLDMARFEADYDDGVAKRAVIDEAREGWERLRVNGSPTFVLPSGRQVSGLGLPELEVDESANDRPRALRAAPCQGDACLDLYRELFAEALGGSETA